MITPIYASLLGLFFCKLSLNVIKLRRLQKIPLGDGLNSPLNRAIRAHGNFIEYVPMALLLITFIEWQMKEKIMVHLLCLLLLMGRLIHSHGITKDPEIFKFRIMGMVLTFFVIIVSSFIILGLTIVGKFNL
jgi:uncharacterized membrane protein YecN with MAPEG domain